MSLPDWLTEPPCAQQKPDTRLRKSWVRLTINKLDRFAAENEPASRGIELDPRSALISFVTPIVCATLLNHMAVLAAFEIIAVALSLAVGANPRTILWTMAVSGGLTAVLMLPAASNSVTHGRVLAHIGRITFTDSGLQLLSVVTLRTTACVVLGLGLFCSDRPEKLFEALRSFKIPGIFVAVLVLTYRNLQAMARAAAESHLARKSRVADESDLVSARKWLGERMGALLIRSRELGEEVHLSMISRGFDGEWIPRPDSKPGFRDFAWPILCTVLSAAFVLANRGLSK